MNHKDWKQTVTDAVVTGTVAGIATTAVVAACGARDSGSAVAPVNATSHIVWGSEAASVEAVDLKHTATGFLLNHGAAVFWAALYERAFGADARRGDVQRAMGGAAAVAALAYVTDYHLVPKRLTPGWEARLSGRSLALTYAALALSLPVRGLLAAWRARS